MQDLVQCLHALRLRLHERNIKLMSICRCAAPHANGNSQLQAADLDAVQTVEFLILLDDFKASLGPSWRHAAPDDVQ